MKQENSVMCAVDINHFDQDVVDVAATLAESFKVDLDIFYVTDLPGYDPQSGYYGPIMPLGEIYSDNQRLKEIQPTESDVRVRHWHLLGSPKERLIETVKVYRPQMVVVGTHGRKGLKRLLLGSIAEHLLRNADCPVMILRQAKEVTEQAESLDDSKKVNR